MENKNGALIGTIAATVVCGLPGLCLCLMGGMFALVGAIPGSDIDIGGSSDPQAAITLGLSMLCGSFVLLAIPVAVGFFTLRKKSEDSVIDAEPIVPVSDESIPPAS